MGLDNEKVQGIIAEAIINAAAADELEKIANELEENKDEKE